MYRRALVAGEFYPGTEKALQDNIKHLVEIVGSKVSVKGVMTPHAGYTYSGSVAGALYSRVNIPNLVAILGPNHSGYSRDYSIMVSGKWATPLGEVQIHSGLAQAILERSRHIKEDAMVHFFEHSLEVQVPFLQYFNRDVRIVPIMFGGYDEVAFVEMGKEIAEAIKDSGEEVLIVASSDMSHHVSQEIAKRKDDMVIQAILKLDEVEMLRVVKDMDISMCGFAPASVMLSAAKSLGAQGAELVKYMTSGDVTGDYKEVVGYASVMLK